MLSSRGKIRLALFIVAFISLGTSFLSLSYMHRMATKIEEIAYKDAKIAELGEELSIKMLEARREEKNFIIYFDTLYIDNNQRIIDEIKSDVNDAKEITEAYSTKLDSIEFLIERYSNNIRLLVETFQEDPRTLYNLRRQVINYEEELQNLAKKRKVEVDALPSWTSDINISILSAATKLSAEKSKLFTELREVGNEIMKLTQQITTSARESLAKNSSEGMKYSVKAERNTLTLLLLAGLLLLYMIFYLPQRIFLPFKRMIKILKAIGRGETEAPLPDIHTKDELGELSRSFQEAIHKLKFFNDLKTSKIADIERNFRRVLTEIDEAVILLTPDLRISYANVAAREIFAFSEDINYKPLKEITVLWEILGKHFESGATKRKAEYSLKIKKMDLRKKNLIVIPGLAKSGKLESVLLIVK